MASSHPAHPLWSPSATWFHRSPPVPRLGPGGKSRGFLEGRSDSSRAWAGRGKDSGFGVEFRRWVSVACALAASLVLGITREAGESHRAFGRVILSVVGGSSVLPDEGSGDLKR